MKYQLSTAQICMLLINANLVTEKQKASIIPVKNIQRLGEDRVAVNGPRKREAYVRRSR